MVPRGTGNFLRPLRDDPLVTKVTVWTPGTKTDSEGNTLVDPRATPVVLEGWDIQPIPSNLPPSFAPSGAVEAPNVRRAFVPVGSSPYLAVGRPIRNETTGEEYRIAGVQNWQSHLEVYLEVSN